MDASAENHLRWMSIALEEAARAATLNEAPVGAVVVHEDQVIARACDQRQGLADPTAHAEILALREAGRILGDWRLDGCDLYVTLEPCPMCAGAILMARIRCLVYGAPSQKAGAVQTHLRMLDVETFNHRVNVVSGVMADEATAMLETFFRSLRNSK